MTTQPDLFRPMCATSRGRQGELFTEADAPPCGLSCGECGRPMVRTASGYLFCPMAHGKLLTEGTADPEPEDEPAPPLPWPQEARRIGRRHAARDHYHGRRWSCCCGACRRARADGLIPRIER